MRKFGDSSYSACGFLYLPLLYKNERKTCNWLYLHLILVAFFHFFTQTVPYLTHRFYPTPPAQPESKICRLVNSTPIENIPTGNRPCSFIFCWQGFFLKDPSLFFLTGFECDRLQFLSERERERRKDMTVLRWEFCCCFFIIMPDQDQEQRDKNKGKKEKFNSDR